MLDFKREITKNLSIWFEQNDRKPLILKGARQVGKSYIIRSWGKSVAEKGQFLELNFEKNQKYTEIFANSLNPLDILQKIELLTGVNLKVEKSVLFIDEVQIMPKAITALRYFYEEFPQLAVITAGSLVEFGIDKVGVPVGRIEMLNMYPLNFYEFLDALNKDSLATYLREHDLQEKIDPIIHQECLKYLLLYYRIGGMPQAIKAYLKQASLAAVSKVHQDIVLAYKDDFAKYAREALWEALECVFQKSVYLISNSRVKYVDFDKTIRGEKTRLALELLIKAGIISKVVSSKGSYPLAATSEQKFFKIIFLDIGLLQYMAGFDWTSIKISSDLTDIFKGALAEQFVGQEFLSQKTSGFKNLNYWYRTARSSNAEVDFLIEKNKNSYPVEVKSGARGSLKSLSLYCEKNNCKYSYVLSQRELLKKKDISFLPLYLASSLLK